MGISDMAFLTNIPRSTLSEWLSDKRKSKHTHMRCVRDFLGGNYVKDTSAVCSDLLIKEEQTMKIELTEEEVKRLISLLKGIYDRSTGFIRIVCNKEDSAKTG